MSVGQPKRGRCHYCKAYPVDLTKDHVIARSRGGTDRAFNFVPACGPCNLLKAHSLPNPEHVANCRRCHDAVEYHWHFIMASPRWVAERLRNNVSPLFDTRPLPARPVEVVMDRSTFARGWSPYQDDYPGDIPMPEPQPQPRPKRRRARSIPWSPTVVELKPGPPILSRPPDDSWRRH